MTVALDKVGEVGERCSLVDAGAAAENVLLKDKLTAAYLLSEEEYTEFLDGLLRRFATEACKRNGIDLQT